VSAALDMPIGSIGPTRARCLDHLKKRLQAHEVDTRQVNRTPREGGA
jgi:hypothetical protein